MDLGISGRKALVCGASAGLGFACAQALAREGVELVIVARTEGPLREAAEKAISSQLLDITIDGARGILFNVTGGPNLTLFEVNQAAAIIKETAHPDVNLIFGAVIDPKIGEEIRITVIDSSGFRQTMMLTTSDGPM